MQDVAAARARLIDLFVDVGRSLIEEHCGPMPASLAETIRGNVAAHLTARADSDIIAMGVLDDDELREMARAMLIEPFRQIAEAVRFANVALARNGLKN